MKRIVVLGSTGSIGAQTLDVVRRHADKLEVVGLAVGTRVGELLAQAREFAKGRSGSVPTPWWASCACPRPTSW